MYRGRQLLFLAPLCVLLVCAILALRGSSRIGYRNEFEPEKTRNLPDCIIFGAKKGGTRALLEFINLHPDVEISPREVHHFNFDSQYKRGLEWYRSQMPLVNSGQLTVEKSPNYFISSKTPQRIRDMDSNMKLILAVREPVERAISDFLQSFWRGNKTFESMAFLDKNFTEVNTLWWPIRISTYARQMQKWLQAFPVEQILVVECADLTADPAAQMQRVEQFLGLRPHITSSNFYFEPAKGFMCWRRNATDPGRCLGDAKGRKHPDVHPVAVSRLRRHFAKSNRMFYEQVGRDFKWPEF